MGFSRLGEATKVINDGVLRVFICALDRKIFGPINGSGPIRPFTGFFLFCLGLAFSFSIFFFND